MTLQKAECVIDGFYDMFESHNEYFGEHLGFKNFLLIFFGLLTDIIVLTFLARWVHYGGTWRFIIAFTLTYILHLICLTLFQFRPPENNQLWESPGFPSLTIPYNNRGDFYFSMVPAVCILVFQEFRAQGQKILMCLSILALIGDFYLIMILKGHYSIDLFGGLILGDYCWLISNNYLCYYVDVKILGLTLHERFDN